jgi:hypothetical protein
VCRNYYYVINKYLKNKRSALAKWEQTHKSLSNSHYSNFSYPLVYPIFLKDIGLLCECELVDHDFTLRLQSHRDCKKIAHFRVTCKNKFTMDNIDCWKVATLKKDEKFLLILGNFKEVGEMNEAVSIDFTDVGDIDIKSYYYTDGLFNCCCTQWESLSVRSIHHDITMTQNELIVRCAYHKELRIQQCISIKKFSEHSFFWNMDQRHYFFVTDAGFHVVDMVKLSMHKLKMKSTIKSELRSCNSCHFWNPVEKSLNIIIHGDTNKYISIMNYCNTWKVIYRDNDFAYKFGIFCSFSLTNVFFNDTLNTNFISQHQYWKILKSRFLNNPKDLKQCDDVRGALIPWTLFHDIKQKYPNKKIHKISKRDLITSDLFLDENGEIDSTEHRSLLHNSNYDVIKLSDISNLPPVSLNNKRYLTTF